MSHMVGYENSMMCLDQCLGYIKHLVIFKLIYLFFKIKLLLLKVLHMPSFFLH